MAIGWKAEAESLRTNYCAQVLTVSPRADARYPQPSASSNTSRANILSADVSREPAAALKRDQYFNPATRRRSCEGKGKQIFQWKGRHTVQHLRQHPHQAILNVSISGVDARIESFRDQPIYTGRHKDIRVAPSPVRPEGEDPRLWLGNTAKESGRNLRLAAKKSPPAMVTQSRPVPVLLRPDRGRRKARELVFQYPRDNTLSHNRRLQALLLFHAGTHSPLPTEGRQGRTRRQPPP